LIASPRRWPGDFYFRQGSDALLEIRHFNSVEGGAETYDKPKQGKYQHNWKDRLLVASDGVSYQSWNGRH
jgi:hypothetical protein